MLNSLRSFAASPIGLIVFGLLIIGLLAFGLSFTGRENNVARVGSQEIGVQEFADAYQATLNQYAQAGQFVSPAQAAAAGLPGAVLGDMLQRAALDDRIENLGLGVSDEAVALEIARQPRFQTSDGQFNQTVLDNYLRSTGLTQDDLIEEERQQVLRSQIARAVVSPETPLPPAYADLLESFFLEERVVNYAILGPDLLDDAGNAEPSEEELNAFFQDNAGRWQAPELRTVDLLEVTPARLAEPENVTDEEVAAAYEDRRAELGTPEQRTVSQLIFATRDEANRIADLLAAGSTYEELVADGEIAPTSLGTVARTGLFDPAVAEAAFAMEEGGTEIVEGRSGATLVHVSEVIEGDVPPLEEVAADIRQEIAEGRATPEVSALFLEIEDARAAGLTLPEVAEQTGLDIETATIDDNGNGPDGGSQDLPGGNELVTSVFESDVGLADAAIRLDGEAAYVWYEVTEVAPERQRTLDEVRDQVVEAWRADAVSLRLEAIAESAAGLLRGGEPIDQIEANLGIAFQQSEPLLRSSDPPEGTSEQFVQAVFGGPVGFVTTAPAPDEGIIVFRVADVTIPEGEPGETGAAVIADRQGRLATDLISSFINDVANRADIFNVGINQSLVDQVVGLTQ